MVEEIDVSDKYNELSKQREELWKKCQKTDSKKKESELREQVRKLDKQIDSFYWLDEWKGEYKEGKFQRKVTIDVKDDYKVGLGNCK